MNYDNWKSDIPDDELRQYECKMCGKSIEKEGFCAEKCTRADEI